MVDHVEFESPSMIENFLAYWRQSGNQRAGYLYGRYEAYEKVPLGVKAVVCAIYEMAQSAAHDYIQIDMQAESRGVDAVARELGLVRLGVIYTDLLDQ
jgi:nuclear protein localization family protein 4